ncbi:MAG: ribonuclease III domain-containing protein [Clostridia bacterium]
MKNFVPINNNIIDKKLLFEYHPLVLSLIGDGVHTLFVRTMFIQNHPYSINSLHQISTEYVCAQAQAKAIALIVDTLTEDENFIYRKCKNAHSNNIPKHATKMEYHLSSAFEGLLGFLYLNGQNDRLQTLLSLIYNNETQEKTI